MFSWPVLHIFFPHLRGSEEFWNTTAKDLNLLLQLPMCPLDAVLVVFVNLCDMCSENIHHDNLHSSSTRRLRGTSRSWAMGPQVLLPNLHGVRGRWCLTHLPPSAVGRKESWTIGFWSGGFNRSGLDSGNFHYIPHSCYRRTLLHFLYFQESLQGSC